MTVSRDDENEYTKKKKSFSVPFSSHMHGMRDSDEVTKKEWELIQLGYCSLSHVFFKKHPLPSEEE